MTQARRRARRWVVPGYALTLTVAVTAPLLAPGYLLHRDAVSTPRSYLSDAALGLGGAAPRAVPQDFLIAVTSTAVDGGLVVKALLLAGLVCAGWGAARLARLTLPEAGLPGELVATTLAIWNPYVAERLLQGHWSLLVGYGCLPWVAMGVIRLRDGAGAAGFFALAFWLASRQQLDRYRWFLKLAFWSLPLPWVAIEAGWLIAEYGRQPWIIDGVLPTFLGTSSLTTTDLIFSLTGFLVLYTCLLIVEAYLMFKFARLGPSSLGTGRYHFETTTPEPIRVAAAE